MKHALDPDVVSFVKTGVVPKSSPAFLHIPTVLGRVRYWSDHTGNAISDDNLLVTTDFALTVHRDDSTRNIESEFGNKPIGSYRPVSPMQIRLAATLSSYGSFNAYFLTSKIRASGLPFVYTYTPPKVTRSAQSFDDLSFFSIPPSSRIPIDLPKPQSCSSISSPDSYTRLSFEDYSSLCEFLGLD
ncbi:hypothetical protein CPB85DRAFT_1440549 [Mucidula mucida]|nr:hypothetical protein CPB85DRAFT_1440549 [Mucidula mucida]